MTVIGTAEIDVQANTSRFVSGVTAGVGGVTSTVARLGGAITGAFAVGRIVEGIGAIGIAYQDSLNTFSAVADKAQLSAAGGLKAVGAAATQLGNDLTLPNTSAADAAQAMTELAKAGLSVNDTMKAAKGTLELAAAGSLDEASAAKITANALNTFHLAGTKAADVANTLANAANVSSGEVSDFAQALSQGGLMAHNVGLSINETAGALALFANNGLQGSDAGTSLKTMLQRLEPQTTKASNAMKDMGLKFTDAKGNFLPLDQVAQQLHTHLGGLTQATRTSTLYTIFGSDAIRAATLLYGAGGKGVDHYTEAVGKSGGAAAIAAAKSQGLGGALRGLQSQAETLALQIFNDVAPSVESLVRNMSTLMPVIGQLAHIVGEVLGPALSLTGTALADVAGVVGRVTGFFEGNKTAASALAIVITAALLPAAARLATALAWRGLEAGASGILGVIGILGRLRTSITTTTATATTLSGKMRALGGSALVGRIGIAALAYVAVNSIADLNNLDQRIDGLRTTLGKPLTGNILDDLNNKQSALFKNLSGNIVGSMSKFGALAHGFTHPIDSIKLLTGAGDDAIHKMGASIDIAFGNFHDLVGELHKWPTPQAQQQTAMVLTQMGISAKELSTSDYPALVAKVREWLAANKAAHNPTQQAAADITALGSGAQDAAGDVKSLTAALDLLAGDALSADQQAIAFRNDIDVLDKALKKSGGSLSFTGKAARDARDAFDGAAQQALQSAEAQAKLNDGTDRARKTLQAEIGTLKAHAGSSDYAKAAIGRLQAALDGLPGADLGKKKGGDFSSGYAKGISAHDREVIAAATHIAQLASATLGKVQVSFSPSRVAFERGAWFTEGYALGIRSLAGMVTSAVTDMVTLAIAGTQAAISSLKDASAEATKLGLSTTDVNHAIARSLRSDTENAERDRDKAVAQLGRAKDRLHDANKELEKQTEIYKPLRHAANQAADAVKHLQDEIDAEEHKNKPNEDRIKRLRREKDAADDTAASTKKLADSAQKGYDKATAASKKWADAVDADSKRVKAAQRALADAFRQAQVDAASAILDTLSAEVDTLVAKADNLKGAFNDAVQAGVSLSAVLQSITSTTDGVTTQTADPVATYIGTLQTDLADSTALATDIGTLVGMGLNDGTIQEIIKLGPAAGDAFAKALIAAGPEAITQINTLITGIDEVATHGMDKVAEDLYGPGAKVLQSLINGIRSEFPELDATIAEVNAKLDTIGAGNAAAAAVSAATAPTSAAKLQHSFATFSPTTTVVIKGNADKSTVDELRKWSKDNNADLVRLAQTGVK